MTRPRITTSLRVGTSVVCLVACVLLVLLWWRSYWIRDFVRWGPIRIDSALGSLSVQSYVWTGVRPKWHTVESTDWVYNDATYFPKYWDNGKLGATSRIWGQFQFSYEKPGLCFPHWFLIIASGTLGTLAAIPWIRWRFSLKTLLITTAIISAVLGLGVWLARG